MFFGRIVKKKDRRPAWPLLAETFSTSPLKPLSGILRNFIASNISRSSIKFVFFKWIRKTRWPPRPLIGWDIFYSSSETPRHNLTKLDRKEDFKVHYQVCVFLTDRGKKMATPTSDWLIHYRLSSETAERNSTKLDRKQAVNVPY